MAAKQHKIKGRKQVFKIPPSTRETLIRFRTFYDKHGRRVVTMAADAKEVK